MSPSHPTCPEPEGYSASSLAPGRGSHGVLGVLWEEPWPCPQREDGAPSCQHCPREGGACQLPGAFCGGEVGGRVGGSQAHGGGSCHRQTRAIEAGGRRSLCTPVPAGSAHADARCHVDTSAHPVLPPERGSSDVSVRGVGTWRRPSALCPGPGGLAVPTGSCLPSGPESCQHGAVSPAPRRLRPVLPASVLDQVSAR